jgi:hypothetical protein
LASGRNIIAGDCLPRQCRYFYTTLLIFLKYFCSTL